MYEADTQSIKAAISEDMPYDRRVEFDRTDLFSVLVIEQEGDTKEKRRIY